MNNSDETPQDEAWKPLAALPSEDSLHLDSQPGTPVPAVEIKTEDPEVEAIPTLLAEAYSPEIESEDSGPDSDIEDADVDESESVDESDASDDTELEDLPVHERMEINPESGAVSGKPYENKHRKGTLPWIQTEHEASAKLLDEIEEEFERNRNVLRIAISMSRSARILKDEKLDELSKYQETRDSLAAWIAERQGTYAWTLLEALGRERDKLQEFEDSVKKWTETTTTEIIEQSRKNKKKFIRRIGFGFAGIFLALGLGALVNLFLGWLGITWIVTLLAFIGFTNPFVWVPNFLIGGSVATWLASLFGYFRSYMKWRKMVDRHVAEARYYVSAVKSLQSEKGRILSLHGQMEDYLKLLSEILHKPWEISDEWLNWAIPKLNTDSLPTSMVVAKPLESGEYETVRKHALESFASRDWRSEQVEILFEEYELAQKMHTGSLGLRFDKDAKLRAKFLDDLLQSDLLVKVGDHFVQELAMRLQSEDLPQATQFHVASLKPDVLESLDLSKSMFDDGQTNKNWTAFVAEILGKATAWSPLAFSLSGRFKGLEKRSTVTSYALIPDRIRTSLDSSVTPVVMEGVSGSGVEAVVRVDLSHWVDPNYLAILDESKPKPSDSESVLPPKTPEVKTESSPVAKPEPPAGPKGGRVTF